MDSGYEKEASICREAVEIVTDNLLAFQKDEADALGCPYEVLVSWESPVEAEAILEPLRLERAYIEQERSRIQGMEEGKEKDLAFKILKEREFPMEAAAGVIQGVLRGNGARSASKTEAMAQYNDSASVIQRQIRTKQDIESAKVDSERDLASSAKVLQSTMRGRGDRRNVASTLEEQARRIEAEALYAAREASVGVIQGSIRGRGARAASGAAMRGNMDASTAVLQGGVRGRTARASLKGSADSEFATAAPVLQGAMRGREARAHMHGLAGEEAREMEEAALRVQGVMSGRVGRRSAGTLREEAEEERLRAVACIQGGIRSRGRRKGHLDQVAREREAAGGVIVGCLRGRGSRLEASKLAERAQRAEEEAEAREDAIFKESNLRRGGSRFRSASIRRGGVNSPMSPGELMNSLPRGVLIEDSYAFQESNNGMVTTNEVRNQNHLEKTQDFNFQPLSPLSRSAGAVGVGLQRGAHVDYPDLLYHDDEWVAQERREALINAGAAPWVELLEVSPGEGGHIDLD